jgi:hypothetical protein
MTPFLLCPIKEPSSNHQIAKDKDVILFNQLRFITNLLFL